MAKKKFGKKHNLPRGEYLFIARVERNDLVGTVSLHLIQDHEVAEVSEGAEFVTVEMQIDPFKKKD